MYIYDDGLTSPWIDASWDVTTSFESTTEVFSGTYAIEAIQRSGGALSFLHGEWGDVQNLNAADYESLGDSGTALHQSRGGDEREISTFGASPGGSRGQLAI